MPANIIPENYHTGKIMQKKPGLHIQTGLFLLLIFTILFPVVLQHQASEPTLSFHP